MGRSVQSISKLLLLSMKSQHQRTYEIVCLNVYCMLLNSGTTTVEDGHELLYKKLVFLYRVPL